jgi:ribonuclease HII
VSLEPGHIERALARRGFLRVAGVDEAGRGALAGPLVAAAVILPTGWAPDGLRDSKLLTPAQRDRLYAEIRAGAVAIGVKRITNERLDRIGLQTANIRALQVALRRLDARPDYVLVDGLFRLRLRVPSLRVIKGDRVSTNVAAASIVAKVTRDRMMLRLAERHRGYGWERNKGYGAPEHLDALDRLGPTPAHRRCFATVAQLRMTFDEPTPTADHAEEMRVQA